jgi:transcriptional regulator with GAF, ATPase, and Fis domain
MIRAVSLTRSSAPPGASVEPQRSSARPSAVPAGLSNEDRALRGEILERLRAHDGNISAVARDMGKARQQLQRWLRRLGIDPGSRDDPRS